MRVVKRRIALLLSLCLVFSNVMPAFSAETSATSAGVQAPAENGEQTEAQTPDAGETAEQTGNETKEPADASNSEDSALEETAAGETVSGEDAKGSSGKAAEEDPAGADPQGEPVDEDDIPSGWAVTPEDAASWYVSDGKYNVYFNDSAYIGYYPAYRESATDVDVTVYKAEGASENTAVIVEGGNFAQGTKINVDDSISDNTFVAHGSIVERDTDYIRVEGLNEQGFDTADYEKGDKDTVIYESGWTVYTEKELDWLDVDYLNCYLLIKGDAYFDGVDIYDAGNKYWNRGSWRSVNRSMMLGAEQIREVTESESANFVVKTEAGYSWLPIRKNCAKPDTSKLNVELRKFSNRDSFTGFGVEIFDRDTGELFDDEGYRFGISSNYTGKIDTNNMIGNTIFSRYKGAMGTTYDLYVSSVSNDRFPSDPVRADGVDPIYMGLRQPQKEDISEIEMKDNSVVLTQYTPDYSSYFDRRGYSRLKFLVVEADASVQTVSDTGVSNWKGRADGSYYDSERQEFISLDNSPVLTFDKMINKNGCSVNLTPGKQIDIYAAWFLPEIKQHEGGDYIMDVLGNGPMEGSPVKLYSFTYTGHGLVRIPVIRYYGSDYTTIYAGEYKGCEAPLFTEEQIRNRFSAVTSDSSGQTLNGTFTVRAISVNDPDAKAFLEQKELSENSLGIDVTEERIWHAGQYYLLAYFEPYENESYGDVYFDAIKKYNLNIEKIELHLDLELNTDRFIDGRYVKKGYELKYDDLSTYFATDVYDSDWDYYTRKRISEDVVSLNNAKYLVRVVSGNKVRKYDEETEEYVLLEDYPYDEFYVLDAPGESVTLDKTGDIEIMIYLVDGDVVGDDVSDYEFDELGVYSDSRDVFLKDVDEIIQSEKNSLWDNAHYYKDVIVLDPGTVTLESRGYELPYGIANQLRSDVTDKYGRAQSFRREQMERLLQVYSNGESLVSGNSYSVRRLKNYVDYIYSTSENGNYDTIDKLSAEDLELGKIIWVKAVILDDSESNAVALKIGKQPINIAAVCPTITDPGQELNGTYKDDIYVYYMNPYPNENARELRTKLSEWTGADQASIDLTGIDRNVQDTKTKTRLSISLNAAKSTHYELRSTAAIYVVRSSSAFTPVNPVVDDDKKTEVKKEEIKHEMYTVQFIDAKTGEKLADSMGWDKEDGLPSNVGVTLRRSNLGAWSIGSDCSEKRIDITSEGIVTNSGTAYVFDLDRAMALLKGEGVSVITFYGYETESVNKYIKVNEIAPVSYNGLAHVSTGDKSKGKSPDLFISVQLVTDDGILKLTEGTDYTLKYADNKKAGNASVTVIGKGAYKGLSSKREFRINPADITQAAVLVNPSYKYTRNGISLTPKVNLDGKALKNGSGKDFTFELTEEDMSRVTGTYNKNSDPHKFRVKVTGNNDYSGTVYSEVFWGVPSNLKALNVTLGTTTIKYENKTYVTATDYQPKATNYDGTVSAQLYDLDYRPLEKGMDTGVYYYVGVRTADPEAAIIKGISPAVTYKKVKFTGLKFNKTMFELSEPKFDFTNSNNAIQVKAKNGASVSWADVQVTFADYYAPDGDEDLPFAKGTVEPKANDGKAANILDNLYPGSYTVYLTGTGRYYGTFKLSYKVNPMKAVLGKNMDIIVNGGNKVYYNAAGYDMQTAPVRVVIKGSGKNGDSDLKNVSLAVSYSAKSSVANGGIVILGNAYTNDGTKIFKNSIKKKFGISACSLKEAMDIPGTGTGAVRKTAVNLGARVPLLTLFQYGPLGVKVIAKNEFSTEDIKAKAAANPDSPFDLEVTPKDVNYTGGKFTVSGVDAYSSSYAKAKLKMSFGGGAEPEGGSYEKKNKNGNLYFKYTGKAVEPKVVIKDKQGNDISDEFYDVTYENNVMHSTAKSPAKAIVEFKRSEKTGQFPYGGKAEVKFYVVTDFASQK